MIPLIVFSIYLSLARLENYGIVENIEYRGTNPI
jgi:hypothetical protein